MAIIPSWTLLFIGAASLFKEVSAVRAASPAGYTFETFVRNFRRTYTVGSKEYQQRSELFQQSLLEIHAVNEKNAREKRSWKANIHPFMDWTPAERKRLNGYKPSHARARVPALATADLQTSARAFGRMNLSWGDSGDSAYENDGPPMRNQGDCGSCWAISAVEAVEAQLQRSGSYGGERLSAQALVDCVPNPRHCGGSGGCDGATGELAYEYMRDKGLPLETDVPYTAQTGTCSAQPPKKRARVSGWNNLPSNQAEPLMQALVQQGPVVVAVDGGDWFNYGSGVFDGCSKDAVLSHAVLARGYGEDAGKKYWLIQNSWGADWGENGNIRLHRHDDESSWCGTDSKPQEGLGCDGGPSQITVCGMCGLLYDPLVPTGVRLEDGDSDATAAAVASPEPAAVSSAAPEPAAVSSEAPAVKSGGDISLAKIDDTNEVSQMEAMLRGTAGPRA
jgi:cathepsin L